VGDDYEPRAFSTYAPLAIGLLKTLPPELHNRSVVIAMKRRLPGEPVEEIREGRKGTLKILARKIARWTQNHADLIAAAEPEMPPGIYNREADNWKPLLAIADIAGGKWPERARAAALKSHATLDVADTSQLELLLADIQTISKDKAEMTSADLVNRLVALDGHPWAEMGQSGKPLTQNKLARMLKPLGITPENIHIGDKVPKGYVFRHFEEAFARALPQEGGLQPLNRSNADEMGTSSCFQTAPPNPDGAVGKCEKPPNDGHKSGRAVAKGGIGKNVPVDAPGCAVCGKSDPAPNRGASGIEGMDVWLHPECEAAYLAAPVHDDAPLEPAHTKPPGKTNGGGHKEKEKAVRSLSAGHEKQCEVIAPECSKLMDQYDNHKAAELLRSLVAQKFPPELIDLALDRVLELATELPF
jgi:hypothetical protein